MATQQIQVTVPDSGVPQPKSGITSSESWGTLIAMFFPILQTVQGNLPPATAAILTTIAVGIYTICRTAVKMAHALGYAKSVPDLPDAPATAPVEAQK